MCGLLYSCAWSAEMRERIKVDSGELQWRSTDVELLRNRRTLVEIYSVIGTI